MKIFLANITLACPMISITLISNFISDYWILFTIFGLVIGLGEAFLGVKLLYTTLFFSGFGTGFLVTLVTFFEEIIEPDSSESAKWVVFFFALAMGVVFGYITLRSPRIGLLFLGIWLGTVISLILFHAVLYKVGTNPPELVLYVLICILSVAFGFLSIFYQDYLLILSTSFCGSYIAISAISLIFGGFPSEFSILQQMQMPNYEITVGWQFYVYMNAIFLLTILSLWLQCKIKKKLDEARSEADAYHKVDFDEKGTTPLVPY